MSDLDPELVRLAHMYFQQHVPDESVRHLCACLRIYPCPARIWAIGYLVKAGRLVLSPEDPAGNAELVPLAGG